ncbi:MAG: UbiD family decarboxylase [Desulfobacterales bacterium]|nr:UbiD family decarboxylase [Desulfobacterales bacterium]
MAYLKDLRAHIEALEKDNLLWRIKSPVVKETELTPLVRWQYRGLAEEERRAFLFENVIDVKGRKYDIPVLVGALAGSTRIYAAGMMCRPEEIGSRWEKAQMKPIPAKLVASGPAQEEVHTGAELKQEGLAEFPFPIDTPGFDGIMRSTATFVFSKDPETGVVNIGNYSGHVVAKDRMLIGISATQHMVTHMHKAKKMGKPLQVAVVIGADPVIGYVAVAKLPYEQDELAVAGGLAGQALEMVKCKTVDLEVPATAEIVVEGEIYMDQMEPHTGSFGEYCGYMAEMKFNPIMNVTCITHRKNPILMTIISQMPPSESSKIRQIAYEQNLLKFLKHDCSLPAVVDVAFHECSGSWQYCVLQLNVTHPSQAKQALAAAAGYEASIGKIMIAVDDDIDPRSPESVNWALSFRMQPHRDVQILTGRVGVLDPSTAEPGTPKAEAYYPKPSGGSALLIDATRNWNYPPVALPRREYMERAREIWEAEGLPRLKPIKPWFGYELGYWPEKYRHAAELNLKGEVFKLGEMRIKERVPFDL